MVNYQQLGRNIAKARCMKGYTQEVLAEKVDVSTVFISQIETSARKPSLETIYRLSMALETSIDTLVENRVQSARYSELFMLLNEKTDKEVYFIVNVLRELCKGVKNDQVVG